MSLPVRLKFPPGTREFEKVHRFFFIDSYQPIQGKGMYIR